jgi:hypothetical protein
MIDVIRSSDEVAVGTAGAIFSTNCPNTRFVIRPGRKHRAARKACAVLPLAAAVAGFAIA